MRKLCKKRGRLSEVLLCSKVLLLFAIFSLLISIPFIFVRDFRSFRNKSLQVDRHSMLDPTFVIFTVTRYESISDLRFGTCITMIKECVSYKISVVIVDDSPLDEVRDRLREAGAIVHRQTFIGRKGAALREAATIAAKLVDVTNESYLCFQEPEKVDMVKSWGSVVKVGNRVGADVVVPMRDVKLFQKTYPFEQYHSETYGNAYLNAVAKEKFKETVENIDWLFGPISFKSKHLQLWTEYDGGDSYDAQIVPYVHAMRRGLTVKSVQVSYHASLKMKEEEEENVAFIEKRLSQLNYLIPKLKDAWTNKF